MPFPSSYAEAAERPIYAALNMLRVDMGTASFENILKKIDKTIQDKESEGK